MSELRRVTLVLGGASSGKSEYAERLLETVKERIYLATATPNDGEMAERIKKHQWRRGVGWLTIEEPLDIAGIISEKSGVCPILVDCLTLWAMNVVTGGADASKELIRLHEALQKTAGPVILVSNEIGLGVVPGDRLSRGFVELQGQINQSVALAAECVVFISAGLPLIMKDKKI
ncbi:MAG: bifunctional adenosylcobinamide kinase/adenosylcobinamide-phosphate guanylyltransferase [Rhodospirillaceae bacterium TMED8]|nr:bifunctional adenosylcobinamide kinase/adenosylcobinamide-phosphate guanylyltransferase [Magnetovibrio sp.]OUT50452.1 MAG: bifunctional adenosylcobinamide kinase/adenosylcobinamide-phosphate guanylyltransferase [Rhodospirillaceae bacterium TMED8]|tara:strand:+ start:271 stop:795 length:525 start_codon:yes stop_codon:yes gene_type:complete